MSPTSLLSQSSASGDTLQQQQANDLIASRFVTLSAYVRLYSSSADRRNLLSGVLRRASPRLRHSVPQPAALVVASGCLPFVATLATGYIRRHAALQPLDPPGCSAPPSEPSPPADLGNDAMLLVCVGFDRVADTFCVAPSMGASLTRSGQSRITARLTGIPVDRVVADQPRDLRRPGLVDRIVAFATMWVARYLRWASRSSCDQDDGGPRARSFSAARLGDQHVLRRRSS